MNRSSKTMAQLLGAGATLVILVDLALLLARYYRRMQPPRDLA